MDLYKRPSWAASLALASALLVAACSGSGNGNGNDTRTESTLVVAVNAGSRQSVTWEGVEYSADRFSTGGTASSTTADIGGVVEQAQALFQTERYGTYTYDIPVTDATYDIELHFVEMFHNAAGSRSFTVSGGYRTGFICQRGSP